MKEDRELKIKELIKFLKLTVEQLKTEIPRLNKGCCGYLAYKIANLLIENEFYSFTFGTITPLWSKTGLKSFEHIWISIEIYDGDTKKHIELNKSQIKKETEYVKQFYMLPALEKAIREENKWAWGESFTNENKAKIDGKISLYMKEKKVHYARECKNAMEKVGENIYACNKLSDPDITFPFKTENSEEILNKWIVNKESGKQDIVASIDTVGVILMSSKKWISFVGLLERYTFLSGDPCGKTIKGKRIGCHSKINCEYFIKK